MKSIKRGGLKLGGILFNEDERKLVFIRVVAAEPVEIFIDDVIRIGGGVGRVGEGLGYPAGLLLEVAGAVTQCKESIPGSVFQPSNPDELWWMDGGGGGVEPRERDVGI
jgi:hypothetical protein